MTAQPAPATAAAHLPGVRPRVPRRRAGDYLDLRPAVEFAEQTKYLDEALHADARHERVSPPLLGSKIRNDMLRAFLAPGPRRPRRRSRLRQRPRAAVEPRLGRDDGRHRHQPVLRGRGAARGRPAARRSAPAAVRRRHVHQGVLARRARAPLAGGAARHAGRGGARARAGRRAVRLHARAQERADRRRPALDQRAGARGSSGSGLIDMRQERLRKSDHLNPLARHPGARARRARRRLPHRAASATTRRSSAASSRTS